jgi:hypothetical protein
VAGFFDFVTYDENEGWTHKQELSRAITGFEDQWTLERRGSISSTEI